MVGWAICFLVLYTVRYGFGSSVPTKKIKNKKKSTHLGPAYHPLSPLHAFIEKIFGRNKFTINGSDVIFKLHMNYIFELYGAEAPDSREYSDVGTWKRPGRMYKWAHMGPPSNGASFVFNFVFSLLFFFIFALFFSTGSFTFRVCEL